MSDDLTRGINRRATQWLTKATTDIVEGIKRKKQADARAYEQTRLKVEQKSAATVGVAEIMRGRPWPDHLIASKRQEVQRVYDRDPEGFSRALDDALRNYWRNYVEPRDLDVNGRASTREEIYRRQQMELFEAMGSLQSLGGTVGYGISYISGGDEYANARAAVSGDAVGNFVSAVLGAARGVRARRLTDHRLGAESAPPQRPAAPQPIPLPQPVIAQTRRAAPRRGDLLAKYASEANQRMPQIVDRVTANQRNTRTRERLRIQGVLFGRLMNEVGDSRELSASQRAKAMDILREARQLARADFGNLRAPITRELRRDQVLEAIAVELRKAGDVNDAQRGALRVRTTNDATRGITFEPLNLEHRIRLTDNPWLYNDRNNLIVTDGPQNQQYLRLCASTGFGQPILLSIS